MLSISFSNPLSLVRGPFISPKNIYFSRFVIKTLKDVKPHTLFDDLMFKVNESKKKDLLKLRHILQDLLLDYVNRTL